MKKILVTIASLVLFATGANSAALSELSPSIGISGSQAVYAATGEEKNYDESDALKTTTKEYGAFKDSYASIFVELSPNDQVSFGIDYVPDSISTPENTSNDGDNENKVSADFNDLTTIYAKFNLPLGGTYLKLGYSFVDVAVNETMNSGNTYKDVDTQGPTVGVGYAHEINDGVSVRAEITGTQFDDVATNNGVTAGTSANGGKNEVNVSDMIGARATISLVKSF